MAAQGKKLNLNINVQAEEVQAGSNRDELGLNSPTADDGRGQHNVNSPTGKDGEYNLNSLMTQVSRDEEEKPPVQQQKPVAKKKSKKPWCSCLSAPADTEESADNAGQENVKTSKTPATVSSTGQAGEGTCQHQETEEDIQNELNGKLGRRQQIHRHKKTVVIDLDETLVHSSFKEVHQCDFIVPVEIDGITHNVYVLVRPGAVEFLDMCAKHYEIVLFTASLAKYADPLLDLLDENKTIHYRLFRDSCVQIGYSYVKDLSTLGRRMEDIMIIDNSPQSYRFQPQNAIPCTSWFDDRRDTELIDLLDVMETTLVKVADVRSVLDANRTIQWLINQGENTN